MYACMFMHFTHISVDPSTYCGVLIHVLYMFDDYSRLFMHHMWTRSMDVPHQISKLTQTGCK